MAHNENLSPLKMHIKKLATTFLSVDITEKLSKKLIKLSYEKYGDKIPHNWMKKSDEMVYDEDDDDEDEDEEDEDQDIIIRIKRNKDQGVDEEINHFRYQLEHDSKLYSINDILDVNEDLYDDNTFDLSLLPESPIAHLKIVVDCLAKKDQFILICTEIMEICRQLALSCDYVDDDCDDDDDDDNQTSTRETWESLSDVCNINQFKGFFLCLMQLARFDCTKPEYVTLAVYASRAYVLLVSLPGASQFNVFSKFIFKQALANINMVQVKKNFMPAQQYTNILELLRLLMQDFEPFIKRFNLSVHKDVQEFIIQTTVKILHFLYKQEKVNNKFTFLLFQNCYILLELLVRHSEQIEATLQMIIMNTTELNVYNKAPKYGDREPIYTHIKQFFSLMLLKHKEETIKAIQTFMKVILTNREQLNCNTYIINLKVAAYYENEIILHEGSTSIIPYLLELSCSSIPQHRINCIEFIENLLTIDCDYSTRLEENCDSYGEREIQLLRMLSEFFVDVNNSVKNTAMSTFVGLLRKSNKMVQKIFKKLQLIKNIEIVNGGDDDDHADADKRSADKQISDSDDSIPNIDQELTILNNDLLDIINHNLKNNLVTVRRNTLMLGVALLQSKYNLCEFVNSKPFYRLSTDSSSMIRKEVIKTIDATLLHNKSNEKAIDTWIKVTMNLAHDPEEKVVEEAMYSFKRYIFENIVDYSDELTADEIFPFKLFRAIVLSTNCPDFRACIKQYMTHRAIITVPQIRSIETYLGTDYFFEASILITLLAESGYAINADVVYDDLRKTIEMCSDNSKDFTFIDHTYLTLLALNYCYKNLTVDKQQILLTTLITFLETGGVLPRNVYRTYKLCRNIAKNLNVKVDHSAQLLKCAHDYLVKHQKLLYIRNFLDQRLVSYIYLFSETYIHSPETYGNAIVLKCFEYLNYVLTQKQCVIDIYMISKFNVLITALGRIGVFHTVVRNRLAEYLAKMLTPDIDENLIYTIISCIRDLCNNMSSDVFEKMLPQILQLTLHDRAAIRKYVLETLIVLILDETIKWHPITKLYMITSIVDCNEEIRELVLEIFDKLINEKSPKILSTILFQSILFFNNIPSDYLSISKYSKNKKINDKQMNDVVVGQKENSPLMGKEFRIKRHYIYRYLIDHLHILWCYQLFEHFPYWYNMWMASVRTDDCMETEALNDFLYICTYILYKKMNERNILMLKPNAEQIQDKNIGGGGGVLDDVLQPTTSEQPPTSKENIKGGVQQQQQQKQQSQQQPSINKKRNKGWSYPKYDDLEVIIEQTNEMLPKFMEKITINDELKQITFKFCKVFFHHFEGNKEIDFQKNIWLKHLRIFKSHGQQTNLTDKDLFTDEFDTGKCDHDIEYLFGYDNRSKSITTTTAVQPLENDNIDNVLTTTTTATTTTIELNRDSNETDQNENSNNDNVVNNNLLNNDNDNGENSQILSEIIPYVSPPRIENDDSINSITRDDISKIKDNHRSINPTTNVGNNDDVDDDGNDNQNNNNNSETTPKISNRKRVYRRKMEYHEPIDNNNKDNKNDNNKNKNKNNNDNDNNSNKNNDENTNDSNTNNTNTGSSDIIENDEAINKRQPIKATLKRRFTSVQSKKGAK